jgi:hypothetical protein
MKVRPTQFKSGRLLATLVLATSLLHAAAANPNPGIYPPGSLPDGKSYGSWNAAFWQWLLSIPGAQNPNEDSSGKYSNQGQSGPVWFLAGNFGDLSSPVSRSISVPFGKDLFLPVYPWIFGSCAGDCEPSNPGVTCDVPTLRQAAADAATSILTGTMDVFIDGVQVKNVSQYRAVSPNPFSVTLPENNVIQLLGIPDAAGTYTPQVADGYCLLIRALPPGKHTISVHSINLNLGSDQTAVYNLTVEDPVLAGLQNVYWRSFYGQITLPKDANGNNAVGPLVFMAVPNAPGDGTPGSINLTLRSDESFFLPLWNLLGNSYSDGTPDDPIFALGIFQTLDLKLTLDGATLVNAANLMEHYSEFNFLPPIPLGASFAPANAFIRLQGISTLHGPLSPGNHVLHLDAKNTDSAELFGLTFDYHNTWNLTVSGRSAGNNITAQTE